MKHGWEIKKLGEVFDLQMGKTPSRDNADYWGGSNVWISIADLKNKYIGESKEYITDKAVADSKIKRINSGVVIMSFKLTVGRAAITTTDVYTNEAIMAFNLKEGYDLLPDYIYYYLRGYKWSGTNKAVMGLTLNKATISENIIAIPPLSVQSKIVLELDGINGILEKKREQIKELDALAQSIFYDMFGDPIQNEKGWEVKRLGDVCSIIGGYAFKSELFKENGIPVLRIGNINTGQLRITPIVYYKEDSNLEKYLVYPRDLVMSLTGTVGKDDYGNVCILDNTFSKYYLNQRNAKFTLSECILVDYLKYFLQNKEIKSQLVGVNRGVRQGTIANRDIERLPIPLPPLPLQQAFAAKIEAIEKQKELVKRSIAETETLLASRIQHYFEA